MRNETQHFSRLVGFHFVQPNLQFSLTEPYQHLLNQEYEVSQRLTENVQALVLSDRHPSMWNHHPPQSLFLEAQSLSDAISHTDADGQPLDIRPTNSWVLKLHQVSTIELLEVQLVNAIAPFIFNSKLKPLLVRSPFQRRFVINVSAMEGQFSRDGKTANHPHTNMAKAALNMMTRTAASDYAKNDIYMNSMDTGWITNENPYPIKMRVEAEQRFYTPLDVIDGMARLYDPIVQGIENPDIPLFGHFLKDYAPYPW